MWFDTFNKPSIQNLFSIFSCHRPLIGDQLGGSPTPGPIQIRGPTPLYALIIGINEYESPEVSNLGGAVPDALAMKRYLEECLKVPESQIRFLCNAEATREEIIQEFNNLVIDQRINPGDPILIFYAGHGGETYAPKGWEAGDAKIQMLIPYDFTPVDKKKIESIPDRVIDGIPDRTVGALLSQIAKKKNDNNITVIFDCCHSGSGTRVDPLETSRMARVTEIPNDVPSNLDQKIWGDPQRETHGAGITPGFLHHGLSSHVLLAACKSEELAFEHRNALHRNQVNGVFTAALLNTLYAVGAQHVTYADLFRRLPKLEWQNPQCEGINRNHVLFKAKAQSEERVLFNVEKNGDNYVMDAGTARGIDVGDEFALYKDPRPSQTPSPLGTFVVHDARPFDSTIAPLSAISRFKLPKTAFALLTKAGTKQDLRVYVARHKKLKSTFKALIEMQDKQPHRPRILGAVKEHAELGIHLDGENAVFDILDERVTKFNMRRIPFPVKFDLTVLYPILDAAAYFHWHLHRTDEKHNLQDMVRLEFTKMDMNGYTKDLGSDIKPIGDNLIREDVINLVASEDVMYGMKILNNSKVPLYASLFYFDNSNLSIESIYQPPFPGHNDADPPLPPNGCLKLGYGSRGERLRNFTLNKDQDVEVGFLKLFLSTEYVDLSDIPQSTPFADDSKCPMGTAELPRQLLWDTILTTVVIRKE